jgi:hypothetical protein
LLDGVPDAVLGMEAEGKAGALADATIRPVTIF